MYLMYGTRVVLSFVILPTIISINHVEQTLSFVICNVFFDWAVDNRDYLRCNYYNTN